MTIDQKAWKVCSAEQAMIVFSEWYDAVERHDRLDAHIDGRNVGYLTSVLYPDHRFLAGLHVLPEFRGRGIATALVERLVARGEELRLVASPYEDFKTLSVQEHEQFTANYAANRKRLQDFYSRFGFVVQRGKYMLRVRMVRPVQQVCSVT